MKKNDRQLTEKNVSLVDHRNYFINFLIFTEPPLGGEVKAVFLPHLLCKDMLYERHEILKDKKINDQLWQELLILRS